MPADPDRRAGLTEWECAAEDIDRAEWALLEALDAGDAGCLREDRLAQCQRRAGRLRSRGPGRTITPGCDKPCRDRPTG